MPGIDFREARARLRLAEVLELLGFEPWRRAGDQVRGRCPVHRSQSPASRSFAAHLSKGVWRCFSCGGGGNALDLWAAVTGQRLHAAVLDLCGRLGREVPWLPPLQAEQAARVSGPRRVLDRGDQTMHDP
jgi:DNA primase